MDEFMKAALNEARTGAAASPLVRRWSTPTTASSRPDAIGGCRTRPA